MVRPYLGSSLVRQAELGNSELGITELGITELGITELGENAADQLLGEALRRFEIYINFQRVLIIFVIFLFFVDLNQQEL